jgi:dolichol kinase
MEPVWTLATGAAFCGLFMLTEAARHNGWPAETTRRVAHAVGAAFAATFPWFLHLRDVVLLAVGFTLYLSWTWMRGSLRSVHDVARPTVGALVFPAGLLFAALVTWTHPLALAFAALVLAFGDTAAAMVGSRRAGVSAPRMYRVSGGTKTVRGSAAMFAVTLALALGFGALVGDPRPLAALIVAAALTVIEGSLGYGLDNLPLPLAAGLLAESLLGL